MKYLEDNNVCVTKLVTDRHIQVSAYMANEKPEVEHSYDVWHVAKGMIVFTVYGFHYYIYRNLVITLIVSLPNLFRINNLFHTVGNDVSSQVVELIVLSGMPSPLCANARPFCWLIIQTCSNVSGLSQWRPCIGVSITMLPLCLGTIV